MRAVLFDLGHTLIDYYHEWKGPEAVAVDRVYNIVEEACCVSPDKKEFVAGLSHMLEEARERKLNEMVEVPLHETLGTCFRRSGCDSDGDLIVDSMNSFYQTLLETRALIPGTVEMLERVKERGLLVGLVSDVAWGLPSEYPLRDLRHFRLDGYFDDMVFSTDVGLRKPNPKIFKIALYNLGVKPSESVFIGNSLQADVKGAKGVGMLAILKDSKYYQHDDNIVPDGKIADWSEIDSVLDIKTY